ncbi:hypothetical protein PanWU01x14_011320 [Parasponia andersonii]|uniref:Uncharacterized protein n=1 Tax=Parasponia andersonii TaxID=3476 RepID=A0A2P5E1L4_PARAD|nr:hypothetical protein PanWU01x14_011320 [Parasponia andersonii]
MLQLDYSSDAQIESFDLITYEQQDSSEQKESDSSDEREISARIILHTIELDSNDNSSSEEREDNTIVGEYGCETWESNITKTDLTEIEYNYNVPVNLRKPTSNRRRPVLEGKKLFRANLIGKLSSARKCFRRLCTSAVLVRYGFLPKGVTFQDGSYNESTQDLTSELIPVKVDPELLSSVSEEEKDTSSGAFHTKEKSASSDSPDIPVVHAGSLLEGARRVARTGPSIAREGLSPPVGSIPALEEAEYLALPLNF